MTLRARVICLAVVALAARSVDAQLFSCYSYTITAASTSICPGGTASYCSLNQAAADIAGLATKTARDLITTTTAGAAGTTACALVGGTRTDWWLQPANACPRLPVCPASCGGTTAAPAPATPAPSTPLCCSFLIDQVNMRCSVPSISTYISATASLGALSGLIGAFAPGVTSCATSGCAGSSLSCFTANVSPLSTSFCRGGSASYCTATQGLADAMATGDTIAASLVTQIGMEAIGTAFCLYFGGQRGTFWTDPTKVCPKLSTCSAATCGSTAPPTIKPLCCAYIKDMVSSMCTGSTTIDTLITAGTALNSVVSNFFGASTCSDTDCFDPRSGAGAVSYSMVLVMAMLMAVLGLN